MIDLVDWVRLAGALQLAVAVANLALPRVLDYRRSLAPLSPLIRQIFLVHSAYIVLVLAIFGGLSVLYPATVADGSPPARFLAGSLAIFWHLRTGLQLFYYDSAARREHLWIDRLWLAATTWLGTVYSLAFFGT